MAVQTYNYLTPGDYTYDSTKIDVSGSLAKLLDHENVYARWHLNEATGATVLDTSGNGRDGIPINSPVSVAGKLNNCLQFDGLSEYINCGNIANFERTDTFSLECWIKTSLSSAQAIMSRNERSGLYRGWIFYILGGNIVFYLIANNSIDNRIQVTLNTAINDGLWHHIIITYDGSSLGSGVNIYLDGSLGSTTINTDNLSNSILTPVNCNIGAMGDTDGFFGGLMDEAVIYDRELTPAEVTYRYNSGIGRENWKFYSDKPTIEPTNLFDPVTVQNWDSFLEALGGANQGSIGYNLYKVDKANKYYWNGSAWVTGGSENNYNTAATINSNIGSFDASPDIIGITAYLISDGEQQVELDENQITYTVNIAPSINAGSDKTCKHETYFAPFSDCSFSDPTVGGSVDHAYYDIEGSGWTEILIGGYGSLLEAVQAFTYQFNNIGSITCNLRVEDNEGDTSEDSLIVTVLHYIVTFNVKDSQGNHLGDISFNPGDGTGWSTQSSPFTYAYEYNVVDYSALLDKAGYTIVTLSVSSTDHEENATLLFMVTPDTVASAVWDKLYADHTIQDSFGYAIGQVLVPDIKRLLGLSHENVYYDQNVWSGTNLISSRVRVYSDAASVGSDTNVIATYLITASNIVDDTFTSWQQRKV